ncbi:MAG TPA: hypothetical protein VHE61_22590 [Opitutaceae bacterium]|nr:hypothetical protein [Opitutaceae bacterium]
MSPSELNLLHVIHVGSVIALIAYTFYAFAAAPETRKRVMIGTGIASLLVLLTGIRMWQGMFNFAFMGWVIVKLVCWLGLSALTGMAYRKREKAAMFMTLALVLAVIALVMVYWKPTL